MTRIRNQKIVLGYLNSELGAHTEHSCLNTSTQDMYAGLTGHYGYPNFPDKGDHGGPLLLYSKSRTYKPSGNFTMWGGTPNGYSYTGSLAAIAKDLGYYTGVTDGAAWGAEAYAKMKPTKPSFSALNSIYELKDVPQMLRMRFHHQNLKDLGNFHLGLQFGWLALLRDVRNFVLTHRKAQERLKWLLAHNGKPVRRRIELASTPPEPTTYQSPGTYSAFTSSFIIGFYNGMPSYRGTEGSDDRVWASARCRYWLPGGPRDVKWTRSMIRKLYGIDAPSPSVIYNAIPWSWLIDWFSNLGDLIENLDTGVADRLAYDYLYVMRQKRTWAEIFAYGTFHDKQNNKIVVNASSYTESSTKTRLHGDPFGFNTNQNSLTGMQLSILGALGLSRLR